MSSRTIPPDVFDVISHDPFAQRLGIEVLELGPGYSRVAMPLAEDMVNFHGMPHGAAIFALADAAFAAAGNSHGTTAIALSVTINYLAVARRGSTLFAEAHEEHLGRRTGLYRLTVTDDEGRLIASCQALAYRKDECLLDVNSSAAAS